MIADDVRLDLVNKTRMNGKAEVSRYFGNYEKAARLASGARAGGRPSRDPGVRSQRARRSAEIFHAAAMVGRQGRRHPRLPSRGLRDRRRRISSVLIAARFKPRGGRIRRSRARCGRQRPESHGRRAAQDRAERGSLNAGGEPSWSPLGQNSSASDIPRLTQAADDGAVVLGPERQSRKFVAPSHSRRTRIAIQVGMTQTGSHPMSRIRIDCSVRVIHEERLPQCNDRPFHRARIDGAHARLEAPLEELSAQPESTSPSSRTASADRGQEILQPAETRIEAEDETQHVPIPLGPQRAMDCFPPAVNRARLEPGHGFRSL